jgi:hypothetical protein
LPTLQVLTPSIPNGSRLCENALNRWIGQSAK